MDLASRRYRNGALVLWCTGYWCNRCAPVQSPQQEKSSAKALRCPVVTWPLLAQLNKSRAFLFCSACLSAPHRFHCRRQPAHPLPFFPSPSSSPPLHLHRCSISLRLVPYYHSAYQLSSGVGSLSPSRVLENPLLNSQPSAIMSSADFDTEHRGYDGIFLLNVVSNALRI